MTFAILVTILLLLYLLLVVFPVTQCHPKTELILVFLILLFLAWTVYGPLIHDSGRTETKTEYRTR